MRNGIKIVAKNWKKKLPYLHWFIVIAGIHIIDMKAKRGHRQNVS
jgi:hypothetical protein